MIGRLAVLLGCGLILGGGWLPEGSAAVYHFGHLHSHPYSNFYPYPDYYDYGGWGAFASAYELAAQRKAFGWDRQLQLESSLAQTADWRAINHSLQAGALIQRYNPIDGGQAARDWMYEMQRRIGPREPVPSPSAAREIMLWPTLLKSDAFAAERYRVEAPFRRAMANGKPLSAEDYQTVVRALEAMKMTLQDVRPLVIEAEYAVVEDYLDNLLQDAQNRLDARTGK
jgi:hypothetical protein